MGFERGRLPSNMTSWSTSDITGPDGEDWRVPVAELATRQANLAEMLAAAGLPGALIQHPVDLYYYAGGRQDGSLFVPAKGHGGSEEAGGDGPVAFVRRSLRRATWEAGGDDAPHRIVAFPRLFLVFASFFLVKKIRNSRPWSKCRCFLFENQV